MEKDLSRTVPRRALLRQTACGFGMLGLASLLAEESKLLASSENKNPLEPKPPHVAPTAKRVIF